MAKERKSFFGATEELEKLQDELFGAVSATEETLIDISKLNDFHSGPLGGQPYRIDEEAPSFKELAESIESGGVAEPLIVRKDNTQSGCYEIISGHRRKAAAIKCGIDKLPCVVREYTDDEANIFVADGNIHRTSEEIYPSEKAWAYRMKLEAVKRMRKDAKETGAQLGHQTKSIDEVAENSDDSRNQIKRYIRLTYLIPQLLYKVDAGKMPFMVGVELSYLTEAEQDLVLSVIDIEKVKVSLEQAQQLKRMSKEAGEEGLKIDPIFNLLKKVKKAPEPKLNESYINRLVPEEIKSLSTMQKIAYTRAAIEHYNKWREDNPEEAENWTSLYE
jgi:ParB family chromosome partitioning protein